MNIIRNSLAVLGLLSIAGILWLICMAEPAYHRFNDFDSKASNVYEDVFNKLLNTGNMAEATVWKQAVNNGLTASEVEEVMKFVANEHNIKNVGELPLGEQVSSITGKPFRFMKIYMFCDALTAAKIISYSDAYSAYLPCRVTLLEDTAGKLWLYSLNMDLMIYGGDPLPEEIKQEALNVKNIILDIMKRGASGEF